MNNPTHEVYTSTGTDGAEPFEEAEVVQLAREGDRAAFATLVRVYQRKAYAVAYSFVGNREDALELAQESFARAYRAMHRFDTGKAFYPWLHRIVRNACLNHLKKKRRHGETSLDGLMESGFDACDTAEGPARRAEKADTRQALHSAMRSLSPEHREILTLRHFQELSYREIAECLAIPQGTVMSRLHAARQSLRVEMEKWLP